METPILLDIPKLTDRILDNKINLFEKIKNMQTNMDKNDIKKKDEEKSCEKNLEKKKILNNQIIITIPVLILI